MKIEIKSDYYVINDDQFIIFFHDEFCDHCLIKYDPDFDSSLIDSESILEIESFETIIYMISKRENHEN